MALMTYNELIGFVRSNGERVAPRDQMTTEIVGLSVGLSPGKFVRRHGMNLKLAFTEALMLVGGFFDLNLIKAVAPNANHKLFEKQSDYGARTRNQVPLIIDELQRDPSSRRAVIQYNGTLDTGTDNIACTLTSQYLIRRFAFRSIYTMRSWDLAFGFPNDIIMFGLLSKTIQRTLGIDEFEPSILRVNVGSAHVYDSTGHLAFTGKQGAYCFELDEDEWPTNWPEIQELAKHLAYSHYIWGDDWPTQHIHVYSVDPHFLTVQ